ncbi:MAG: hypothetical protein RSE39_03535 [Oscillospiraceae bacterium]
MSDVCNLIENLLSGQEVGCTVCHKGTYITDCEDTRKSQWFYCNNCGSKIHIQHNTEIE